MPTDSNVTIVSLWLCAKGVFFVPRDFLVAMFLNTSWGDLWAYLRLALAGWRSAVMSVWAWALLTSFLFLVVHMVRSVLRGSQARPTAQDHTGARASPQAPPERGCRRSGIGYCLQGRSRGRRGI
jgi:hypothetical protein